MIFNLPEPPLKDATFMNETFQKLIYGVLICFFGGNGSFMLDTKKIVCRMNLHVLERQLTEYQTYVGGGMVK